MFCTTGKTSEDFRDLIGGGGEFIIFRKHYENKKIVYLYFIVKIVGISNYILVHVYNIR